MASKIFSITKDPDAVLDYTIDWTSWLDSDTISTSGWTPDAGITVDSASSTSALAIVWLSGGTAGNTYKVVNQITTAAGRTDDRTVRVFVDEK